jgi:hypothetical protein
VTPLTGPTAIYFVRYWYLPRATKKKGDREANFMRCKQRMGERFLGDH